jgi:hypothetical protein
MIKNAEEVKKKEVVFSEEALSIVKPGWGRTRFDYQPV